MPRGKGAEDRKNRCFVLAFRPVRRRFSEICIDLRGSVEQAVYEVSIQIDRSIVGDADDQRLLPCSRTGREGVGAQEVGGAFVR